MIQSCFLVPLRSEGKMARAATLVTMTTRVGAVLDRLLGAPSRVSARFHQRLRIIKMASQGKLNVEIAREFCVDPQRVRRWRKRWVRRYTQLDAAEKRMASERELTQIVSSILADKPRSGAPPKFTAEQLTRLMGVACEKPEDSGIPTTHWTAPALATQAQRRGIFDSISARHVGRFLKEVDLRPHMSRYWLTSKDKLEDPDTYHEAIREICRLYADAPGLHAQDIIVVSTDERTGIQALERLHPTLLMKPGFIERREYEYKRHGTLCLIGNFIVATGQVYQSTISETRTEEDFVAHIAQTVGTRPNAGWVFVADQLNTHASESLVRFVAEACGITEDLGVKGKSGILKSFKTTKRFLSDTGHRVRFVYTPRHCSWMNQVEIWFSILSRRLLRRGSFGGKEELRERLEAFIGYFNEVLAKPLKWTYAGKPLTA